jgi:hypothetical protein
VIRLTFCAEPAPRARARRDRPKTAASFRKPQQRITRQPEVLVPIHHQACCRAPWRNDKRGGLFRPSVAAAASGWRAQQDAADPPPGGPWPTASSTWLSTSPSPPPRAGSGRGQILQRLRAVAPVGVEPTNPCGRGILNPQRLPFRHGARTHVDFNRLRAVTSRTLPRPPLLPQHRSSLHPPAPHCDTPNWIPPGDALMNTLRGSAPSSSIG